MIELKEIGKEITKGFPLWRANFYQALHEAYSELILVASWLAKILNLNFKIKGGIAILAALFILVIAGTLLANIPLSSHLLLKAFIGSLGIAGFGLSLIAQRLKYNKHTLALIPVSACFICLQMICLGGWSYAVMAFIAGSRALTISMISDHKDNQRKRRIIALGFYMAGLPLVLLCTFHSYWSLLNAVAMTCGTLADSLTSDHQNQHDNSHRSRFLRLFGQLANAIYNLMVPQSWAAFLSDIITFINKISAILKHDVCLKDSEKNQPRAVLIKKYLLSLTHPK